MHSEKLEKIELKLFKLQRSIKCWRIVTITLILGGGLLAAGALGPTIFDHIVVNRIDVIGEKGTPVVSINGDSDGGRIDLYNQQGVNLLRLSSTLSGGDIALWDNAGTNVAGIWSGNDGGAFSLWNGKGEERSQFSSGALTLSGKNASLHIRNEHGNPVAIVASDPEGHGRFQIADALGNIVSEMRMIPGFGGAVLVNTSNEKQMVALAAGENGGQLNIMNKNNIPIIIASSTSTQGGAISIANQRGIPIALIKTEPNQNGLIELLDADGNGARRMRPIRGYSP